MIKAQEITHVAFADESHWNVGRHRGLGLVTLRYGDVGKLEVDLNVLLQKSNVTEFKWKTLDGAKERFAAQKMCRFAIDATCKGRLRIDILEWDMENSRHKIRGRDDIANLQRMYYHMFKNVLRKRWPDGSVWGLYPDEHTKMDWANVWDFLDRTDSELDIRRDIFTGGKFVIRLKNEFKIEEIRPVKSHNKPLIQLADLFVGLGIFSREHYERFAFWEKGKSPQLRLRMFEDQSEAIKTSRADKERFTVLAEFNKLCKEKRLGVSLKTNKGLKTFNPENPINFWWYDPQHLMDKAPTKG